MVRWRNWLDAIIRENGVSSGIDVIFLEIYDEHRPVQETNAYIPLQVRILS
jgi:hypothetical protein